MLETWWVGGGREGRGLKYLLLLFLLFLGSGFRLVFRLGLPLASEESPRERVPRATGVHLEGLEVGRH